MRGLRILIVDDDSMISGLLTELLESDGHAVCGIKQTEDEAVSAAARDQPDLMIIDVTLDVGDGIQAMQRILRTHHVPHVFISGGALPPGAIALRKPFRQADLRWAIDRALAGEPAA